MNKKNSLISFGAVLTILTTFTFVLMFRNITRDSYGLWGGLIDYSGPNGATHSGAFGASIPVHSAPPPKWRKLGLETGE